MKDTLITVLVLVGILVVSALITNWFAAAMYIRCKLCGTLNAKRRIHCRACNEDLRASPEEE